MKWTNNIITSHINYAYIMQVSLEYGIVEFFMALIIFQHHTSRNMLASFEVTCFIGNHGHGGFNGLNG